MQVLTAKEIDCAEQDQLSYEIQWTIPNWRQVRQDVRLARNQKAVFETGLQPSQMIQTKWLVGLKGVTQQGSRRARVYWQLLDIKGSGPQLTLYAKIKTTLCRAISGYDDSIDEQSREVNLGDSIYEKGGYLDIGIDFGSMMDQSFINSSGAIQYKLILTFKIPDNDLGPGYAKKLKLEQFSKRSHAQLRENLATLSNDLSNGDLKIITSDGVELRAYRTILRAQCPVFAGMLNSDLSESKTGIVNVEDISGKTMKILLHYFYTGDLDGWNDPETIVEFTYAAGKYQVTQVLELLDDLFGRSDLNEVSSVNVQLLNLAGKLSLKNAEKRLLEQIIGKVAASKSGEELFQLFGYDSGEVSSKVEALAGEPMGESKVWEILEYTVGNTTQDQQVDFSEHGLVLLAFFQRNGKLKGLEQLLLKKIAEITSKFTTAEELFKFFGDDDKR